MNKELKMRKKRRRIKSVKSASEKYMRKIRLVHWHESRSQQNRVELKYFRFLCCFGVQVAVMMNLVKV